MASRSAGTGYVIVPEGGSGPGILVLHAWWGLTPFFKGVCDRLADNGFVALAPDLYGGKTTSDPDEAKALLAVADMDATLALVRSSVFALRAMPATPDAPVGALGFSMGASWALWLASRVPEMVDATAIFYGTQSIDMAPARSAFLGNFAETDPWVEEDELTLLEADLHVLDKDVTFHRYRGTGHWFFESDQPAYDEAAAELAWDRTLAFFREHLTDTP
ncbi:MAG TPA: dienelactone hydrolase family protein [Acidimicrobiales bacterium]|jgi:carboxymethylenebutenolidase|nr:dienelactone hydrolase family protein [Acidimicrobiales bacterium]